MGKLFGTDGIRAIAGDGLDADLAFRVGQAAAIVLTRAAKHKARLYIGKDTRISSDMLEAALIAGVTSAGADVILAGVIPTPAIAYLTKCSADAGVVISASHNPFEYNGIKIFSSEGFKLSDSLEDEIESLVAMELPSARGGDIGRIYHDEIESSNKYIDYLHDKICADMSGLNIAIDCANGASAGLACRVFEKYNPKKLTIINNKPDGVNINDKCGSTNMSELQKLATEGGYDIALAFDGDADRCLAVDENGAIIDGDKIMALCALNEKNAGKLPHNAFVATVMSNMGLHEWADNNDLKVITAPVGDRYVLEEMRKTGCVLGGEQSGHVIFLRDSTTGDGLLTALKLLSVLSGSKFKLSELKREIPQYPQVLINIPVDNDIKSMLLDFEPVRKAVSDAETRLGKQGRVLVRPSGTEALVRIMVESKNAEIINELTENIRVSIGKIK